jgi:hypothetical protein
MIAKAALAFLLLLVALAAHPERTSALQNQMQFAVPPKNAKTGAFGQKLPPPPPAPAPPKAKGNLKKGEDAPAPKAKGNVKKGKDGGNKDSINARASRVNKNQPRAKVVMGGPWSH